MRSTTGIRTTNCALACSPITGTFSVQALTLKELAEDAWEMPEGREKWGFAACTKRYFDKPLIAAVRGKALGGGVEIVAACDLAVASDESIFGLPEPRVGLTAAGGGTLLRLAQQIPMKFAMELLLVAEPISAQKANEWGLVNYVVPDDQVVDKAVELARRSRSAAPLSIKYSKKTRHRVLRIELHLPISRLGSARRIREDHARERRRPRRRGRIRRKAQACLDGSLTDERQPMSHEQSVPHIHSNENEGRVARSVFVARRRNAYAREQTDTTMRHLSDRPA